MENRFKAGSHYRAARLRDPQLIEEMALAPDPKPEPPRFEEFDSLRADLADLKDVLWRILYVSGRSDPKHAPTASRPELPWAARRSEMLADKSRYVRSILLPWEVNE
ncbi:hypothetical protein ACFXG4_27130 [Nocardia sp. NPDC059246]|uniref:hypothetical protein n=1 Tax=unclassified Nocardia TaxID=2637762 RepID=UPI00368EBF87